jgi:hypothetical protein
MGVRRNERPAAGLSPTARRASLAALACALFLTAFWLVVMRAAFGAGGSRQDEALMLVCPERIVHGAIPNRDFQTLYGPGNYWMLAAIYSVFGFQVSVERTVGALLCLAIILLLFDLTRGWGLLLATAAGFCAALLLAPMGAMVQVWNGALALSLGSVRFASRDGKTRRGEAAAWNFAGAGLLAGLAMLFRLDVALAVLISALPLLSLTSARGRRLYAAGLLAGLVPFVIHLSMATPYRVYENFFVETARIVPGRTLPLPPSPKEIGLLFGLTILGAVLALAAGLRAVRAHRTDRRARTQLALGLLSLGLLPYAIWRADPNHILKVGCMTISLLPLSLLTLLPRRPALPERRREIAVVAGVGLVLLICSRNTVFRPVAVEALRGLGLLRQESFRAENRSRAFPLASAADVRDAQAALRAVERIAPPGAKLFVGPADLRRTNYNDTFLYYLLPQLTPSAYYFEMDPGEANRPGTRMTADIAAADALILTSRYNNWNEPNASQRPGSDAPEKVVRDRFTLCDRIGPFAIYRRRAAANAE